LQQTDPHDLVGLPDDEDDADNDGDAAADSEMIRMQLSRVSDGQEIRFCRIRHRYRRLARVLRLVYSGYLQLSQQPVAVSSPPWLHGCCLPAYLGGHFRWRNAMMASNINDLRPTPAPSAL